MQNGTADDSDPFAVAEATPELSGDRLALLAAVPMGAAMLAGIAVALLLIGWLYVYFWIYLPRGLVG